MPYSMKNIPQAVVNLSKAIQKIYIATFNAVYEESKDETSARQAAWANVKKKYEKVGDKWVRKQSEGVESEDNETEDTIEDNTEESEREELILGSLLSEAVFDDDKKTAIVTIIKEGWSKNFTDGKQRYYTAKAVDDVSELLGESRKMFLDHTQGQKERSVAEWTATCKRSWTEKANGKNVCKAEIDFTENPNTVWLYKEAKKHPEEVMLSIQGAGEVRAGKIGEKNASIVESVTKLRSTDFVTIAAAGGGVEKVLTASADSDRAMFVLSEAYKTLDQIIMDYEKEEQPSTDYFRITRALSDFLSSLMWTSEVMDSDVASSIDDAMAMFSSKMKDVISQARANDKEGEGDSEEDEYESESVKDKETKMTLEELKTTQPETFEKLMEEAKLQVKTDVEEGFNEKITALETEKASVLTEKEDMEKKLQEAQTELDKYNAEKILREKKDKINAKLEESKIADKVTDEFKALLEGMEEEVMEKLIADKAETLANKTMKVEGFGPVGKKEEAEPEKKDYKKVWFN